MTRRYSLTAVLTIVIVLCFGAALGGICENADPSQHETMSITIPVGSYSIESVDNGYSVFIEDFGRIPIPGTPDLPSKIFSIAIPPGACVVGIDYETGEGEYLSGSYEVRPVRLARVIGEEDPALYQRDLARYEANFEVVYGSDDPYPAANAELVRTSGYRNYDLVDVRITPFTYQPISGSLVYFSEITVNITYVLPDGYDVPMSGSDRSEKMAESIIYNYEQANAWYPAMSARKGTHDYVILTTESLVSSVAALASWQSAKGRTAEVVTTDWISANYSGVDLAEQMRNFLRDMYPTDKWGIEDVLLVGHYDDVPMRRCWQDLGYGKPETDFYYAELSLPDDQSWDSDQDQYYGEDEDAIDFYPEIRVGRIPWSDPAKVQSICEKSAAYEQHPDQEYKHNMLLLGAYFWADTDNAVLMEAKVDQEWMSEWTLTRMYEKNASYWSDYYSDIPLKHSNVMDEWPTGNYAFVNWAGHGSPTSTHVLGLGGSAFITSGDCPQLSDEYPAIIFADACSNSDTDHLNIGQAMLGQGAVAFVGATKVALGCPGWTSYYSGSSQSLDYFFTTGVTSGEYTVGGSLHNALIQMYQMGLWSYNRYETFEWGSLWGNPDLGMGFAGMGILLVDPIPELVASGESIPLTVEIRTGMDTYIEGSGQVHYRYDGGDFQSLPLTAIGEGIYEVVLPPAECGDVPEFYFSAEGESLGVVLNPRDAPASTYSTMVGEMFAIFHDDFETDKGWTVSSDDILSDGEWERGVPIDDGADGDPTSDYDGSGSCYLTCNETGDSDVDRGATWLYSPKFDVAGYDATISYARSYANSFGNAPNEDVMKIRISNDGGANWTEVETLGPNTQASGGWYVSSFRISDIIQPSSDMKMSFEASDYGFSSQVEAAVDAFNVSVFRCVGQFLCGDADESGAVDIDDVVYLINFIFAGGSEPVPYEAGDVNCTLSVDIDDAVYLISFIFSGGPGPCDTDGDGIPDC